MAEAMEDAVPTERMTVHDFRRWLDGRPDEARFELSDGFVVRMAAERAVHARVKMAAANALAAASRDLPCEVFPDGMAVQVSERAQREPDAALRCGPPLPADATYYDDPVVVVEVLSPSPGPRDGSLKMFDYARIETLANYVIVDTRARMVLHHRRTAEGFETRMLPGGVLRLDPPGIALDLDAILAPARPDDDTPIRSEGDGP